jgi:hypothetical protein
MFRWRVIPLTIAEREALKEYAYTNGMTIRSVMAALAVVASDDQVDIDLKEPECQVQFWLDSDISSKTLRQAVVTLLGDPSGQA